MHLVKLVRLRAVRERRALTQQQLAEKAGISRPTLTRIEACLQDPYPTTVRKLAEALGVDPVDLMQPETS
jgi:transcriptional regulator with XRE-family HTH domain